MDLFIATNGNDNWSGALPRPSKQNGNGPLASLAGAVRRLRALKRAAALTGPVTVHVRGGRYEMTQPLVLTPDDSWPVTFKAYGAEKPVISGGCRIGGWRRTVLNGRKAWVADLPDVRNGAWSFRQLFVNGRRAARPRLPGTGLYRMASVPGMPLPAGWGNGGQTQFVCAPGDVKPFANLADVEVVYVHFWIEERSPLAAFDPASNLVTMARPSRTALVGSHGRQLADYYLDNVREALNEPGQWYLDRPAGQLFYLPRPGETPRNTEIVAPRALQLLAFCGNPDQERYVEFVRFEGLTFAHTDWRHPGGDEAAIVGSSAPAPAGRHSRRHNRGNTAAAAQAACDVPGVIAFEAARHCAIENCTLEHVGWYGVEIGDGCRGIRVVGNTIRDLGAGGVKINGAAASEPDVTRRRTGEHRVTDNEISQGGRVFHSAVGVLSMNAFGVTIAHNLIHDLFYTGISCGWEWGYMENVSRDNRIEFNHIHTIGQGLLSDMGGIYTLGVQPGTVIRHNWIHDIRSAHYGGWCIYPDEGSSHILIEHNVCHDADRHAFHQHYGRENVVLNNIFAFGADAAATYSRAEAHVGFTMMRNIFVTDGKPMFATGYHHRLEQRRFRSELNLFFDASGARPAFVDAGGKRIGLRDWRAFGFDIHSVVANPGFRNVKKRDFRLAASSPAARIGFKPIDLAAVGPRPTGRRE